MDEKFNQQQSVTTTNDDNVTSKETLDQEETDNAVAVFRKLQAWRDELLNKQQPPSGEL